MSKDLKNTPPPQPSPASGGGGSSGLIDDAFQGLGGSYTLDPESGKRIKNETIDQPEIDSSTQKG